MAAVVDIAGMVHRRRPLPTKTVEQVTDHETVCEGVPWHPWGIKTVLHWVPVVVVAVVVAVVVGVVVGVVEVMVA